jgi:hypothetical protein
MSKRTSRDDTFTFSIAEENGDDVTIEIAPEDYERERAAGVEEEFLLKPGRHKFIRGGFLKRHPNFKPSEPPDITVTVTLPIPHEVFKYFERRAAELQADSFQALMIETLRQAMSRNGTATSAASETLLNDDRFIAAVAARVKTLAATPKAAARKRKRPVKAKPKAKAA